MFISPSTAVSPQMLFRTNRHDRLVKLSFQSTKSGKIVKENVTFKYLYKIKETIRFEKGLISFENVLLIIGN